MIFETGNSVLHKAIQLKTTGIADRKNKELFLLIFDNNRLIVNHSKPKEIVTTTAPPPIR